jgi:beta-phosphoglucomutase-like phosphatase (HAD superfamily)
MEIRSVFIFDLDGTLVDSVYQHALAWQEALGQEGIELSVWRIHRKIGVSRSLFTNQLLRETKVEINDERIDRLRRLHADAYQRHAGLELPPPALYSAL